MTVSKIKYFVSNHAGGWIKCKKAQEVRKGFLHYELADKTNGLARPGTWKKEGALLA